MRLGDHTITIERAGTATTDGYGNSTPGWDTQTSTTVSGCSVQPLDGQEAVLGRETVVSRWQLYAPAGTDLLATDRVVYADDTYDVDGEVQRWDNPPLSNVTALLRRSSST